jgi:phage shock protein C
MDEKRLTRSTSERMIAGVSGGLAEYFNIDPTIVRLIFVITALAGGPGLLVYLILWFVMPEEVV